MNSEKAWEILGWYGTGAVLVAYFLNSFSLLPATSAWYQGLNATGAIGVAVASYRRRAYQPLVLNVVWAVIGTVALIRLAVSM